MQPLARFGTRVRCSNAACNRFLNSPDSGVCKAVWRAADEEPKIGTSILAPGRKRPAGSLQAAQKGRGLACLNLQAALAAAEGNEHLELGEGGPQVKPWRPTWWPKDWGEEPAAS